MPPKQVFSETVFIMFSSHVRRTVQ
ncbi:hypothetical protein RV134_260118 [Roseovarius sp. EC-HK134]|nr:hypothetical protein RV134_260118 [Roseovarius sp. EC-HK134]